MLGQPCLGRGQAVQLTDPVQRFELDDEPGPVLPIDGEPVRGREVVLLGQLLVALVAPAVPGPCRWSLRPTTTRVPAGAGVSRSVTSSPSTRTRPAVMCCSIRSSDSPAAVSRSRTVVGAGSSSVTA